jgi:hypothetical protein
MARAEASIVINRSAKEVGDYLNEPALAPEWQANMLETEKTSEGPTQLGTTYRGLITFLGRRLEFNAMVTEFEPYIRTKMKVNAGPLEAEVTELLEPVEGGTRFTYSMEVEPRGFFRLADAIVMRMMQRDLEGDVARLKDILEANG